MTNNRTSRPVRPAPPLYVPPSSAEAEQGTLGAMLIERAAVDAVLPLLTPDDFYYPCNAMIFDCALTLARDNAPVDLISMQAELLRRGQMEAVGGLAYVAALYDTVPTSANAAYHAGIVRQKSLLRQVMTVSHAAVDAALASDAVAEDVLSHAAARFAEIETRQGSERTEKLSGVLLRVMEQVELNAEHGGRMTGLPTGFLEIDRMTGGLQPGDLVVLAARPSMGKTALALAFAERAALGDSSPVVVFSLEMSADQLVTRLVCSRSEVRSQEFRAGRLTEAEWQRTSDANAAIYAAPLHINDDTMATPAVMARECRKVARGGPLSLIIVDYLQLVRSDAKTDNRVQEVGLITRDLKALGREFNVPVIALAQLSRSVESRENKRPLLSDLRESGEIEAAADVVAFLYREAYYKRKGASDAAQEAALEETEVIFAKHRNGPTGYVKVGFAPCFARFDDWQEDGF